MMLVESFFWRFMFNLAVQAFSIVRLDKEPLQWSETKQRSNNALLSAAECQRRTRNYLSCCSCLFYSASGISWLSGTFLVPR